MVELDPVDLRILYELDLNSRQSIADLSRKLRLKRDRIMYRIKKLQTEAILTGFSVAVNAHRLGLCIYKTYLRLEKNDRRISDFFSYLEKHPRISWVAETDGRWDLLFSVYARNPVEFHSVQETILFEFSDIIVNFSVYTLVDAWCFHKSYLVGLGTEAFFFGGPLESISIDSTDHDILKLLAADSRIAMTDIADKVDLNQMVVKQRIEALEEQKIIIRYPINLNTAALGMLSFKAQFQFGVYDRHSETQLLEYCKTNPYVTMFIRQIGDCALEIEMEVKSYQHLNEILSEIRRRFTHSIRTIETSFIKRQTYKWVPFVGFDK